MHPDTLQRLLDRAEIQDSLCRYARGVDRQDWDLVRSTYHPDARDEHGEYRGDIDGFIAWLQQRLAGADNSMHFLGNCLIEFAGPDDAFVETSFVSRRLRKPTADEQAGLPAGAAIARESWGRYADYFERRDGQWRVAQRTVVIEASSRSVALDGQRSPLSPVTWGRCDGDDPMYRCRERVLAKAQAKGA